LLGRVITRQEKFNILDPLEGLGIDSPEFTRVPPKHGYIVVTWMPKAPVPKILMRSKG